jgi:hypothetical protein
MGLNIGYLTSLFGGTPVVPGTAAANQPVVLGASKDIATITSATITTMTGNTVGLHTGTWRVTRGSPVAAAGTNQGNAAALSEGFQAVSGADGTKGVILPTAVAGMIVIIKGTTAGVLKVYPATGGQINGVGRTTGDVAGVGPDPGHLHRRQRDPVVHYPLLPS